jgi:hypothetical protein
MRLAIEKRFVASCLSRGLTSRSSHAERDGEKRSLKEPAVDDFTRAKIGVTIRRSLPRAE